MKSLKKDIAKYKKSLLKKAREKGLYENFGQNEVMKLKDKHINISSYTDEMNKKRDLIQDFNNFVMNCSDKDLI